MLKDVALTWMSGKDFCSKPEVQVYLNSLLASGFKGSKIIFTHDMPKKFRSQVEDRGFDVIDVDSSQIKNIEHDRHLVYYKYLIANSRDIRYVLITDSRDVIFQKDPIDFLIKLLCKPQDFVFLTDEGIVHVDSSANTKDQLRFQENLPNQYKIPYKQWYVINCGIMLGTPDRVRELVLNIWLSSMRISCGDQSALNYICKIQEFDNSIVIRNSVSSNLCITGEGINHSFDNPKPIVQDSIFMNSSTNQPYYIVHQWDRTKYAKAILEKYCG